MNKKIFLTALSITAVATLKTAQAVEPTFYAGGDLTQLTTKVSGNASGDVKPITLRLKGGANILDWLDAEAQIILPKSDSYSAAGTNVDVKTSVIGVFAKPHTKAGPVDVYGLLGLASTKTQFSGGSKTETALAYGVGAQYPFAKNISGSIEYTQYLDKNNLGGDLDGIGAKVSALSIGATYTFK